MDVSLPSDAAQPSLLPSDAATMVRLRLDVAYDGTQFHGWAKQGGAGGPAGLRTVQGVLEEGLSMMLRHPVELTVAGRTDAGVHATGQVAHFDVPAVSLEQRSIHSDPSTLVRRLARWLPADVRVHACTVAPEGFDARFSALRRHYVYRVTTHPRGALPTRASDTAEWPKQVQCEAMQEFAQRLLGLHDFAAFCKYREHATTIRELLDFQWHDASTPTEPNLYEAHVTADAFCWSMVRSLVGASLAVGAGQRPVEFADELLATTQRSSKIPVAPAKGLTLVGVDYPDDAALAARALVTRDRRTL